MNCFYFRSSVHDFQEQRGADLLANSGAGGDAVQCKVHVS